MTFYIPFEKDATAVVAGGEPAPAAGAVPGNVVEGVRNGIRLTKTARLSCRTAGNYRNKRGSVEFW